MVDLAGGAEKMFQQLIKATEDGHYQWGLQLSDYLLNADYNKAKVTESKIRLLRALAAQQLNAPARNYYLSYAHELEQGLK